MNCWRLQILTKSPRAIKCNIRVGVDLKISDLLRIQEASILAQKCFKSIVSTFRPDNLVISINDLNCYDVFGRRQRRFYKFPPLVTEETTERHRLEPILDKGSRRHSVH